MKLIRLTTLNFKKLSDFTTEFKAGLNLIAGDNAQGKSTLLEAIKMALFGVAAMPCGKADIPTWGQTKCTVTLVFQLHGPEIYTLVRTLSTAKLTSVLEGVESLEANGHTPVTARVEDLTGLTIRDWELFIQSSQGVATGILTFGATALNKKVEEFAGVDLIDKVQTLAQQRAIQINARAGATTVSQERLDELQAAHKVSVELLDAAYSDLEQAKLAQQAVGEAPAAPAGPTAAEMREGQRAVDRASTAVDTAEAAVASAKTRVADAEARVAGRTERDVVELEQATITLQKSGTSVKAALDSKLEVRRAIGIAEQDMERADTELQEANNSLAALKSGSKELFEAALAELEEALATDTKLLGEATEAVGTARSNHSNLVKLADGATCPTCKRAKEDHDPAKLAEEALEAHTVLETAKAAVKKLEEGLRVVNVSIRNCKDELAELARRTLVASNAAAKELVARTALDELVSGNKTLESDITKLEAERESLRDQFAQKRNELKEAGTHNESLATDHKALRQMATALETCEDTLNDANDHLESLPDCAEDADVLAAEQREVAYQAAKSAYTLKASEAAGALRHAETNRTNANAAADRDLAAYEAAVKANENAAAEVELGKRHERLVRFLRDRRQTYLKEVWDTVMGVSSRLVRQSSSDLITRVDNRDGNFYYEEGGNIAPTTSASGAQKALIGTSLRMGLSRALYGGDSLMIFDEPTEGCTEFNASNMVATLATSARQVLLITHRENDQALANHIINVG